ncbi:unnamed protein product [Protopolystoma xenopodis]|uniref:Uncharacterized protein n=1 Tax=Protopolystoma xenopodis TaxID=117903 RepID=A0A448XGX9_9PLAT|nr:unnamed protein product [Protopolystoma xenopodis]
MNIHPRVQIERSRVLPYDKNLVGKVEIYQLTRGEDVLFSSVVSEFTTSDPTQSSSRCTGNKVALGTGLMTCSRMPISSI